MSMLFEKFQTVVDTVRKIIINNNNFLLTRKKQKIQEIVTKFEFIL